MSETPRPVPVRAWGEFDEWSVFARWEDPTDSWVLWLVPSGAVGEPWAVAKRGELGEALLEADGALRKLRVLLSGHDGHLKLYRNTRAGREFVGGNWTDLPAGARTWHLYDSMGSELTAGWIEPDTTDTDAVTRALSEATNWLNEAEKAAE